MISRTDAGRFFSHQLPRYLPHLSVDCVVFGFDDGGLRVLLLKWKRTDIWTLPGGFVGRRESLDEAARRVLQDRTGLRRVELQQFHAFGGTRRREWMLRRLFASLDLPAPRDAWPFGRVVSIAYYALVDFPKVRPEADALSEACAWQPVDALPTLGFDHAAIVSQALASVRARLDTVVPASALLRPRFTMPELQQVHEAILGTRLDRRNFQKRMLSLGVVERLGQRRTGRPHRSPFLYRFAATGSPASGKR
jgi:8-oxo-dGTP diphosphatase